MSVVLGPSARAGSITEMVKASQVIGVGLANVNACMCIYLFIA